MRLLAIVMILLGGVVAPQDASCAALQRGTAIIDPATLRVLDGRADGGFGLGLMLDPARSHATPLASDALFTLPSMAMVRKAIDAEFDRYVARHQAVAPQERIGVGADFELQLFDRALLHSDQSRFVLSGIVNRMDRAYVAPEKCGEVRLIYRLTRSAEAVEAGDGVVASPRLPMTLNLVLDARPKSAPWSLTCAEIARRWLELIDAPQVGPELAGRLTSAGGALEFVRPDAITRIETNLQIGRRLKSSTQDFRTDYLLKVFDLDPVSRIFEEAPLENQIDRDRLLADASLARAFREWLLAPRNLIAFDRGTVLIPDQFTAKGAVARTPAGFENAGLHSSYGLMQGEGAEFVFTNGDVVAALKKAADGGAVLQNIRSPAGFARRLNDITCAGCHQTRGIGGFHFPGVDWMTAKPSNSTIVPASPHFFGDQIRRRDILSAFSGGKNPDFSRGFADRPQLRGSKELAGTEYADGWGATCYRPPSVDGGKGLPDPSFSNWSCARDLSCQPADPAWPASAFGMCFVGTDVARHR